MRSCGPHREDHLSSSGPTSLLTSLSSLTLLLLTTLLNLFRFPSYCSSVLVLLHFFCVSQPPPNVCVCVCLCFVCMCMCVCVCVRVFCVCGLCVCVCVCLRKFVLTVFCSSLCDGLCTPIWRNSTQKSILLLLSLLLVERCNSVGL